MLHKKESTIPNQTSQISNKNSETEHWYIKTKSWTSHFLLHKIIPFITNYHANQITEPLQYMTLPYNFMSYVGQIRS